MQPRNDSRPVILAFIAMLCALLPPAGRAAGMQMLHGHVPAVAASLAPVGRLPAAQRLNLAISLPLRNQQGLEELLRELYDPASPRYRHYLTPEQFTGSFGPAPADYEAVAAFAKQNGLTVTQRYPNRLVLDVNGAVSDIEKALHVTMRVYRHPTQARLFYAPDREPSLELSAPISHVSGLDNYALPQPAVTVTPVSAASARPNSGSGLDGLYIGKDFRTAYAPGVTQTGSGQTVGLLQFDGYSSSDITNYETQAGISPQVPLTNVLLDGFNGHPQDSGGQIEVTLDIEMTISMAPGLSKVIVYEAGETGVWIDILNRMVSDNLAKQISCSWYAPGEAEQPGDEADFEEMMAQGQSFSCASGDDDAYTGLIPFPEDSPHITMVGGTQLSMAGTGASWNSETVWNEGNGTGSGGGISTQYVIPAWQQGTSMFDNNGSITWRNTPDVALTGTQVYVRARNENLEAAGTSCASPLWAGFLALVNQASVANGLGTVGFVNSALYTIGDSSGYSAAFHDISTGNNISISSPNQFYAVTGYDLATGLGTPAAGLINALASPPDSLVVSFTSLVSSGTEGGPFTPSSVGFTLSNGGSSPVDWTASTADAWISLSATSGTLAVSGSTTVAATLNGNALTPGSYPGTVTFTDTDTGFAQYRPVNLTVLPFPPMISSTLSATGTTGTDFTYQITATNTPVTYGASGLPAGLSVNSTTGLISGTTTVAGTSTIILSATNSGGSNNATLSLLMVTPYQVWQNGMFTVAQLADPTISGTDASPAGDGISNLMKYALNLNPFTDGQGGLPVGTIVATGSGNYLELTYTKVISATDITYTVQVSTDMTNWYSGAGYTDTPVVTNNSDGVTQTVTVQAASPVSSNPVQFIQLQVADP